MSCIWAMPSSNVSRHADCLSSLTFFGFVHSLQVQTGIVSAGWLRPLLVWFVIKMSALFQAFDCGYTKWRHNAYSKVHPRTSYEGPEGLEVQLYSFTPALDVSGWLAPHRGRFTPGKRPGTCCAGDCVDRRTGLGGCGRSHTGI
jgi:hypothetical protein